MACKGCDVIYLSYYWKRIDQELKHKVLRINVLKFNEFHILPSQIFETYDFLPKYTSLSNMAQTNGSLIFWGSHTKISYDHSIIYRTSNYTLLGSSYFEISSYLPSQADETIYYFRNDSADFDIKSYTVNEFSLQPVFILENDMSEALMEYSDLSINLDTFNSSHLNFTTKNTFEFDFICSKSNETMMRFDLDYFTPNDTSDFDVVIGDQTIKEQKLIIDTFERMSNSDSPHETKLPDWIKFDDSEPFNISIDVNTVIQSGLKQFNLYGFVQVLNYQFKKPINFNVTSCDVENCQRCDDTKYCHNWLPGYEFETNRFGLKCIKVYDSLIIQTYYNYLAYLLVVYFFGYIVMVFLRISKWHSLILFFEYLQMITILTLIGGLARIQESKQFYHITQYAFILINIGAPVNDNIPSKCRSDDLLLKFDYFDPKCNYTLYNFVVCIFIYLLFSVLFATLYLPVGDSDNLDLTVEEMIAKLELYVRHNWLAFIARYFNATFVATFMSCCLSIYYIKQVYETDFIVLIFAVSYIVILFTAMTVIIYKLLKNVYFPDITMLSELLWVDSKPHFAGQIYYFWSILRKSFCIILIVVFKNSDMLYLNLILYILVQIAYLVYLIKGKPFKTLDIKIISYINEIWYLILLIFNLAFRNVTNLNDFIIFIMINLNLPIGNIIVGVCKLGYLLSLIPYRRIYLRIKPHWVNNTRKTVYVDHDLYYSQLREEEIETLISKKDKMFDHLKTKSSTNTHDYKYSQNRMKKTNFQNDDHSFSWEAKSQVDQNSFIANKNIELAINTSEGSYTNSENSIKYMKYYRSS